MKKLLLLFSTIALMSMCALAQNLNVIDNRSETLRGVRDDCQFEIGLKNTLLDVTNKKNYHANCNLDWKAQFQAEVAYKINDSIIETFGIPINYQDTLFQHFIPLHGDEQLLEAIQEDGNLTYFTYELATNKESSEHKKVLNNEKKKEEYLETEKARFPWVESDPKISENWGKRQLVKRFYYDKHHFMWRPDATDNDFLTPQYLTDVVVTRDMQPEANTILGVINSYAQDEWNLPVNIETDSLSYAYVFTPFEGRMAIYVYYTFQGTMKKIRIVARPEAEFEDINFTAEATKDIHEMSCERGKVQIKIKPAIEGTGLNKRAKEAIEWKITFGDTPGTDEVERIGIVKL